MSKQYPGGIISKTAPVPSGPYDNDTAPGIWTLEQQAYWQKLGLWPTAGNAPKDAQFNYVTMLLHGDGTNGAQNNTFLDSSTNNFTITRVGDTTQGSFSPYGSNWGNFFDGTGDYLGCGSQSAYAFGTSNFTMECWAYATSFVTYNSLTGSRSDSSDAANTNYSFGVNSGGSVYFYSAGFLVTSSAGAITLNSWNHIALVRSGTSTNQSVIYVNGVSVGTGTISNNLTGTSLAIGGLVNGDEPFTGYISNVRLNNTAVYTTAFTPPTAPLTAISGTSLLTCQSNRFKDNSTNNFTITPNGNTSVQRFNPFGTATAYSTAVIGGSGYFDGTGDSLTTASSADFGFGTGDFTIECWAYPLSSAAQRLVFFDNDINNLDIGFSPANTFQYYNGSVNNTGVSAASRQWFHFAVSRTSGTTSVYINGVRTNNIADSTDTVTRAVQIGNSPSSNPFNGYINDVRIIKGTGIYSGTTITVPTAPLTAVTNTKLLLNYTNGAIFDNAMINDLQTGGNAQISTSVVKFGTGSMYFDGSGDFLRFPKLGTLDFGTGNFTIEMWVNPSANQVSYGQLLNKGPTEIFQLNFIPASTTLSFYAGSFLIIASSSLTIGAWTHVALVRNNGVVTLYQGGVSVGSVAYTTNVTDDYGHIGCNVSRSEYFYYGYLDDIRITKGVARYTTTFTPPTAAFLNIGPN